MLGIILMKNIYYCLFKLKRTIIEDYITTVGTICDLQVFNCN